MKHLESQKGAALLAVIGALSVLGIMGAVIGANLELNNRYAIQQEVDLDTIAHLDKALSLASYFITNNLVLCRDGDEGKWSSPIKTKCMWGGGKYSVDRDGKTIGVDFYALEDVSSKDEYILRVPEAHRILAGKDNRVIDIKFEIKDFSKDQFLSQIIGDKDSKYGYLDQDNKIILITAEVKHKGNSVAKKSALIRRPFATPVLSVENPPACNLVCASGKSHNPNKECRSKNDVPRSYVIKRNSEMIEEKDKEVKGENHVTLTIRNDGPGAIYSLKFFKKIIFDKKNYPDMTDKMESVDVLVNSEDVLMPGQTITYEDKIPCLPPSKRTQVKTVVGQGTNTIENSVHKENYMDLSYGFNFKDKNSDLIPRRIAEEITTDKVNITRDVGVRKITNYVSPPH